MHLDLKAFLLSGQFGPIAFGMSRQALEAVLGAPDTWGQHTDKAKATIWKYGSFEFYFGEKGDALWMIYTDDLDPMEGSHSLTLDPWLLNKELEIQQAESLFASEQIPYKRVEQPKLERIDLQMASGVVLHFDADEDRAKPTLCAIALMDKEYLQQSNPVKQISITVPLAVYEKLKHEAMTHKKSVSSLCSQWLIEYANQISA